MKNQSFKNRLKIIGYLLIIHFTLLVFDRVAKENIPNLFWISHLSLLLAAIGFVVSSGLLLSGALVAVSIVHSLWIYDFVNLIFLGTSPLKYADYWMDLTLFERVLTLHHVYLIPLLFFIIWKFYKISKRAWFVAFSLFTSASVVSYLFLPAAKNINCAHAVCPVGLTVIPSLSFIATYSFQLPISIGIMAFGFIVSNFILIQITKIRILGKGHK